MTFDPAAATAAYMAQLSPAQHAQAAAYTQGSHWILLWSWMASTLVAWLILHSGLLTALRDRLQRRSPHPIAVSFVLALVFSLLNWLGSLPWTLYAQWWRQKSYGCEQSKPATAWVSESSAQAAIGAIETAIFFVLLYALMRRVPRSWWAWAGGLAAAYFALILFVAPVFIEPLFNRFTPAPCRSDPRRRGRSRAAMRAAMPIRQNLHLQWFQTIEPLYRQRLRDVRLGAHLAMSDVMFGGGADVAEVRGVVGREMEHYVRIGARSG